MSKGHETITLALISLVPLFLFYGLMYNPLLIFIPIIILFLCFHLLFFRDPERSVEINPHYLLAPADGKIYEINEKLGVIRIRMSLFNVHVNRTPVAGEITKIELQLGNYWPFLWFLRRGTEENTRQTTYISNAMGEFRVIQIVGAIARRVKIYFSPGDQVNQGERLGMIFYGSEVDLEFPVNKFKILVEKGTNTTAGITPLAERTK